MNYQFSQARVLVVGDLMLDRYLFGSINTMSKEAPVPICKVGEFDERPGGAANVAANICALGGKCTLMGVAGADNDAEILQNKLISLGIDCHIQKAKHLKTIVKMRVLSRHQQLIRLDFEAPYDGFSQEALLAQYQQHLQETDLVVLSDYGKGTLSDVQPFIQLAKKAGKTIFVDPTGSEYQRYQNASLIIPNASEFIAVAGEYKGDVELAEKSKQMISDLKLQALLVTQGSRGMSLFVQNDNAVDRLHADATDKSIFDVTGASDTVIATAAIARAAGHDWATVMRLANAAAGAVVMKLGTATVSLDELQRAVSEIDDQSTPIPKGVLSETELQYAMQVVRSHGERVVMTNGCFDLLHAGHIAVLQEARKQGDRLIVAVNTDESIQKLKGPTRPILPLKERLEILAGLSIVDWVIPFADDTPERLLHLLKPCVLVKGGDYSIAGVVGADIILNQGGQVKVIPHDFADVNTTAVIKKLEESST